MKKNTSWNFTDESSITFQSSVSGASEFGLSLLNTILSTQVQDLMDLGRTKRAKDIRNTCTFTTLLAHWLVLGMGRSFVGTGKWALAILKICGMGTKWAFAPALVLEAYGQQKTSWLGPPGQGSLRAGLHV